MEKVTGEQALLFSTFLPYKSSCHFRDLNCYHIVHSNANRPETWQFLLFPFLVFTKCQVLNLRVGGRVNHQHTKPQEQRTKT